MVPYRACVCYNRGMHYSRGFTLIEVIVIIAAIGVLAAITTISISMFQGEARDAQRASTSTTISEALEQYYLENGEYPSERNLVNTYPENTARNVSELLGINEENLRMPQADTDQTIASRESASGEDDVLIYEGESTVNNDTCKNSTSGGCDRYQLTYTNDEGEEVIINSRYDGSKVATVANPPAKPSLSVGSGGSNAVVAESSEAGCSENSGRLVAKYSFRYRINGGSWSAWSSWATSVTDTRTGTDGQTFEYQVMARCDDGAVGGAQSPASDIESYTIPLDAPNPPTISVVRSGSNVVATSGTVSCPSGASGEYRLRARTNNGTWGSYSAWSTTRTASQAATAGVRYGYQAQGRCVSPETTSPGAQSTEATYTAPFSTPSAPSVSVSTSGNTTTFRINAVSCPSNATTQYQYRYRADWGYTSSWYGAYSSAPSPTWGTSSQGYQYITDAQARCSNSFTTSSWSGTGSGSYIRPVGNPSSTSWGGYRGDWRTIYVTGTTTCGTSVYPDIKADVYTYDWNWTPTPPTAYGWYRNRFGAWVLNDLVYRGTTVTTGSYSNSPHGIPGGTRWKMSVEKRCRNHTTGRASGIFYQEGPVYTF